MINLYPANKMENLLLLLNKISEVSPLGVFNQEVIIVQNAGMQHWLNLAIAQDRGISMNVRYALPAQFLWQLIRSLASGDKELEHSPYSREVLAWRIYILLASDKVISDDDFSPATDYWQGKNRQDEKSDPLKRYQLAVQLADLFEQYLIFRPQWLDCWQHEKHQMLVDDFGHHLSGDVIWQAKLWQLLIAEQPYNPVELLNDAIANIETKIAQSPDLFPKRLSFFAINTMPPIWLSFINALSDYIEIDFYHLNPCFSYWGDILTSKQALKKLSHWSANVEEEHLLVGNPLLANLGQQGREFLAMLQDYSTVNIDLFVKAGPQLAQHDSSHDCILHRVQNDILNLDDAGTNQHSTPLIDHSITITSCHSALREVQALHDYLLHQFNQVENKLTPKDVLVMCPQIEQYAPYVNAVFTRGWQNLSDDVPPLPCSIADRSAKDSDPLVAAFVNLLSLPDSRFQVNHLLAFIRQTAIANKFSINSEDIDQISVWLDKASIHWGIDKTHKQQVLGENATNSFTWQQGLSRLLQGFSFCDNDAIYNNQLLLADIEGDDAILLGQLMLFIEQLQHFTLEVSQARTAKSWQVFLLSQLEQFFARSSELSASNNQIDNALSIIETAIASFVEYSLLAHLEETIPLSIVTDYLNHHFSQGDASRQFMVGQVTFCSMLPMRSIPFKVIAVLGLNDGEFPRQRQPLGFDLMTQAKPRLGDRSRRGDDRYLFLEAIISARQALYLSYQGRNIKNNNAKQPSLVLKELMDYLSQGYGWDFTDSDSNNIRQMPMQPFSEANYQTQHTESVDSIINSFDANWLKLARGESFSQENEHEVFALENDLLSLKDDNEPSSTAIEIDASQLIRFFQHPSKYFAQQLLHLYLDDNTVKLDDVEPFTADYLDGYLLKQALLASCLATDHALPIDQTLHAAKLSGKFPDLPTMDAHYQDWLADSEQLAQEINVQGAANPQLFTCHVSVQLASNQAITLNASLPVKRTLNGVQLVFYRSSTAKAKDLFTLYLSHLIVQTWQAQQCNLPDYTTNILSEVTGTQGFYFNTKAQKTEQYSVVTGAEDAIGHAEQQLALLLNSYFKGQSKPLLLNGDLASEVFKESRGKRIEMTQDRFEAFWQGTQSTRGFADDAYIQYFWPQCPDIETHLADINALYHEIYRCVVKVVGSEKQ